MLILSHSKCCPLLSREIANGNALENGLSKCLVNVVDFRKNCKESELDLEQILGNALGLHVTMPPVMSTHVVDPETESYRQTHGSQERPVTDGKYEAIMAAAACAVRKSTDAFRANPRIFAEQCARFVNNVHPKDWKAILDMPGFHPVRDCAVFASSWRRLSVEQVDFGEGKAQIMLGDELPAQQRFTVVVDGPGGDGVLCILRLPGDGYAKIQTSRLLSQFAPGASFWSRLP